MALNQTDIEFNRMLEEEVSGKHLHLYRVIPCNLLDSDMGLKFEGD